jgi:hypothetical protein
MKLKDFIKETITSIIIGVQESQIYIKEKKIDCEVCPIIATPEDTGFIFSQSGRPIRELEFDVLVSVSEKTNQTGMFEITVGKMSLGKRNNRERSQEQESRLKFSLPITLPYQEQK